MFLFFISFGPLSTPFSEPVVCVALLSGHSVCRKKIWHATPTRTGGLER
ncbi:putative signal peptide protein [Puccinia sorghi]|uniref:Putative signal peptide protein n=1 Tax=Puccinia sorghi TaxID=27349 RepID=A0A0L6UX26_9BASI|nr:putative signal peptide protein [Puccinia sorghi]